MPSKKSESNSSLPAVSGITPRLLTIQEAARYLSATVWATRALLWSKQLKYIKIGKRHLIAKEDLDRFVDSKLAECTQ